MVIVILMLIVKLMLNPKKKNVSSLAIGMSHLDFIFYDDHA
jgi:hypothetical protein